MTAPPGIQVSQDREKHRLSKLKTNNNEQTNKQNNKQITQWIHSTNVFVHITPDA